jgi:ubiquinone/menaquinone biosynthesis C-methylase UbiE
MDVLDFSLALKLAFDKQNKIDQVLLQSEVNQYFLNELDKIITNEKTDNCIKMTQLSVLFEGFYRHLDHPELKKTLTNIKARRWEHHFGTPTVTFLLSYKYQIDQTKLLFDEFARSKKSICDLPWLVNKEAGFVIDNDNGVITDAKSISQVAAPQHREVTGIFTKTHNPFGGFTTTPCDPFSQQFIEHAAIAARSGGRVLEIGAAFGAATLEAIAKGATVFCNDIHPENLAVVRQRFMEMTEEKNESITGDNVKLVLVPGEFPNELVGLPEKSFAAILICRVLHFFTGVKIEESLAQISKLLAAGGKIYIVCETPYLKNWQRFIPEFNRRVECNVEWPGEITTPADYESSGRAASLPAFVHWITKEVLERSLLHAGFAVEHSAYINRSGQFPNDLLLPEHGKESVGAIGIV